MEGGGRQEVSEFIFELLSPFFSDKEKDILDPCVGAGSLLKPWKENKYRTLGIDIDKNAQGVHLNADFFKLTERYENGFYFPELFPIPQLVICNPPFNGMKPKLAPEIWLDKILELFGKDIPIVLFAPIGLRICNSLKGKRYQKWINGTYPKITSIISLPRTIFPNIEFHTEILIFNIKGLESHYFYHYAN